MRYSVRKMRIFYDYKNIPKYKNPVAALGVFDGMHKGHRFILKAAVKKAKDINGTSIVVTFHPHPQREKSLYSLKHRIRLIEQTGVDICIIVRFNQKFAAITAENFIKNILVKKINPCFIYIGKNFTFGKAAKGNYKLLDKLSGVYRYKLKAFDTVKFNRRPISSTYIRKLIADGKLGRACELLGRPVSVLGTVIKGRSLARKMGFPTANINPHHEVLPPSGVYSVRVGVGSERYGGLCHIGSKPTLPAKYRAVNPEQKEQIEVYILDFNKDIYGKELEIEFIRKIREEKKFLSLDLLAAQIRKDISTAEKSRCFCNIQ